MATTTTSTTTTTTSTQPPYSSDDDLLKRRSNIISLGIGSWAFTHYKARDIVNRDLESGWYRQTCGEKGVDYRLTPFSPGRMLNWETQVKDLSVFKTFELAYEYLSKDSETDVYMALSDRYAKKYEIEFKRIIKAGIDYDWDADNVVEALEEKAYQKLPRQLSRI